MKEMSKVKAYLKKSLASILLEKNILTNLHHNLIANLNFSFQDKEYLYLVLDYLPGGDLRYYLSRKIKFNESQIKFIISNLILSLNYIHNNNVIHRDIKPENLVFDDRGYLHITDFGISRKIKAGKSILDKSGTPGYISPEVLLNKPQNFCSDFFSVGVICYELLLNKKPFKGKNKKEVAEKILHKDIRLTKKDIPEDYSLMIGDFINKLLKRNNKERLGNRSIKDIMNHPWLEKVEWENIEQKNVLCENIPFLPSVGDNFDDKSANKKEQMDMEHYDEYLKKINDSGYFKSFYFNYFSIKKSKTMHEKNSGSHISHKISSPIEGFKTAQSEGEIEIIDINMGTLNPNISYVNSNMDDISGNNNKKQICTDLNIAKNCKINIKANTALPKKSKCYEKEQLDEFNKSNLFEDL